MDLDSSTLQDFTLLLLLLLPLRMHFGRSKLIYTSPIIILHHLKKRSNNKKPVGVKKVIYIFCFNHLCITFGLATKQSLVIILNSLRLNVSVTFRTQRTSRQKKTVACRQIRYPPGNPLNTIYSLYIK